MTLTIRKIAHVAAAGLLALTCAACGDSTSSSKQQPAAASAPAIPADVESAAEASLGSEAEVLVFGDLAKNGHQQVLAINRLNKTPEGASPGILLARASIIENDAGTWKEIFRCDEHLKNPKGFLGGTPLAPVNSWRLQYEQDPRKGLAMYFTPLAKPAGGYAVTIPVLWNPEAMRYQVLSRDLKSFLGETVALEIPESQIR